MLGAVSVRLHAGPVMSLFCCRSSRTALVARAYVHICTRWRVAAGSGSIAGHGGGGIRGGGGSARGVSAQPPCCLTTPTQPPLCRHPCPYSFTPLALTLILPSLRQGRRAAGPQRVPPAGAGGDGCRRSHAAEGSAGGTEPRVTQLAGACTSRENWTEGFGAWGTWDGRGTAKAGTWRPVGSGWRHLAASQPPIAGASAAARP